MLSKKSTIIVLLFFFSQMFLFAQTRQQLKEYFTDADFFFEGEDYREALFNYLKIHDKDSVNANINYCIGMCYMNIPGEETKAIPYFEKAASKISTKYRKSVYEERSAPLYLLFYLGTAYRIDNQLTKALAAYNKFRNHPYFEGHYNEGMVDIEIGACERAKLIQDNPINARFTNIGPPVNNALMNRNPVLNKDETILIYLSSLKFYDAIFMSRKVKGVWGEPVNISSDVGSDGDCEPTCLSADGKELYFVKKMKKNSDIYVSVLKDSVWGPMQPLNKNINTSHN
jgi:tetratricopeptide (TPR) repeat protein